jgi:NAD(P)-dependent dehydrogenase (short-subunit alcohol dehydrogenase family)
MGQFNRRSTAEEVAAGTDLRGRHAVITGANTGIGRETARVLAGCGASVTLACRDPQRGAAARDAILAGAPGLDSAQLEVRELDLASFESVRRFAEAFLATDAPVHLLINNAGVMLPERRETQDGFEAHFGINHLGHFLLTNLLLDRIRASAPARVVNLSSEALRFASLGPELEDTNWEKRRFSGWRAYGDSKLMNVAMAVELTRRAGDVQVVAHALHPGLVSTELSRYQPAWMNLLGIVFFPFMKNVERGAATTLFAATAPECAGSPTRYLADCAPAHVPRLALDATFSARLWQHSAELTQL